MAALIAKRQINVIVLNLLSGNSQILRRNYPSPIKLLRNAIGAYSKSWSKRGNLTEIALMVISNCTKFSVIALLMGNTINHLIAPKIANCRLIIAAM